MKCGNATKCGKDVSNMIRFCKQQLHHVVCIRFTMSYIDEDVPQYRSKKELRLRTSFTMWIFSLFSLCATQNDDSSQFHLKKRIKRICSLILEIRILGRVLIRFLKSYTGARKFAHYSHNYQDDGVLFSLSFVLYYASYASFLCCRWSTHVNALTRSKASKWRKKRENHYTNRIM